MSYHPEIIILDDHAFPAGSSNSVAITSAIGLAARGLLVTYFSCVGPVAPRLHGVPGLKVVCLDQREPRRDPPRFSNLFSGLLNARAMRALRNLLSSRDPSRTIVHVHTWMKALSPFALRSVVSRNFPLVVTLHDYFIACPNGGFFVHPTGQICRRRPLSPSCLACNCDSRNYAYKVWDYLRTLLQNRLLALPRRITRYIGVSEFSAAILRPHLPPNAPFTVLRSPIDSQDEGPASVGTNRAFLYVGPLTPEKGVRLFAEAVAATGVPAVFVGEGELLSDLRRLCPEARFTSRLDPVAIRAELRAARALVLPSLWHETLGVTAIEAVAAGVPAIVSDGGAATDHIRHGENGLYFSRGSSASLAVTLQKAAQDDALVIRLGATAYRWYWADPWTPTRHIEGLLEIYRTLSAPAPEHQIGGIP